MEDIMLVRGLAVFLLSSMCLLAQGWTMLGYPKYERGSGEASVNLGNGKVLIFGGRASGLPVTYQAMSEVFDSTTGQFTTSGSLNYVRDFSTGTLLSNGTILICGGGELVSSNNFVLKGVAEIYNPLNGEFTQTGSMVFPRAYHSAVKLMNGKVLIFGGKIANGPAWTAEIYDPGTGQFSAVGTLIHSRQGGQCGTLLQSGKVLISGGTGGQNYCEVFDPTTNQFSLTSNNTSVFNRTNHTATLLNSGNVLMVGGYGYINGAYGTLQSVEIYNPSTNSLTVGPSLLYGRTTHGAAKLPNGNVLIAFGWDGALNRQTTEIYNPVTNMFQASSIAIYSRAFSEADPIHFLLDGSVMANGYTGSVVKAEKYK